MNKLNNFLNLKMTPNTHVIKLTLLPIDSLACSTVDYDDSTLYFWSDECKNFVTLYFDYLLPYNLLLGYSLDEEFEEEGLELNFENVINYLLELLNNDEEKETLLILKQIYDEYYNKDIDYLTFIKLNNKLENLLKIVRLDFIVDTFYTPLECRHLSLEYEEFNANDLESNFKNFKDINYLSEI